jgi:FkbM family methyltransferase
MHFLSSDPTRRLRRWLTSRRGSPVRGGGSHPAAHTGRLEEAALRLARSVVAYQFRAHLNRQLTEGENIDRVARDLLDAGLTIDQYEHAILNSEEYRLRQAAAENREVVEFHGCKFNLPTLSLLIGQLKLDHGYEPWVLPEFLSLCRPGMHVVDVGANWGVYAIPVSRLVGAEGRVWAFEANSKNAEFILESIELNACTNVQLVPAAVGEAFRHAIMPDLEATNAGAVVFDGKRSGQLIPVIPLDAVLADAPRVDLIKMDIEGSEYRACLGARRVIQKFRPTIFLEFCPSLLKAHARPLIRFFLKRGYDIAALPHNDKRRELRGSDDQIVSDIVGMCGPQNMLVDLRMSPR